jgi:hypothetical protein
MFARGGLVVASLIKDFVFSNSSTDLLNKDSEPGARRPRKGRKGKARAGSA